MRRLSVRTVHPSMGLTWLLFAAAEIGCCVHVSPPSEETATSRGAAPSRPLPLKFAQQTYTEPKNGLDDALSAHTCSLSENVVDDCMDASTGGIQPFLSPAAAAATLSVRETPMASNPLNVLLPGTLDGRFASYRREPFAHPQRLG